MKLKLKVRHLTSSSAADETQAAFYKIAEYVIDTQVEYTQDERDGWVQVTHLKDGITPLITFEKFPEGAIFILRSCNLSIVHLGLKPAAAAISYVAMNWTGFQARDGGRPECARIAHSHFLRLHRHILSNAFTSEEQRRIMSYAD